MFTLVYFSMLCEICNFLRLPPLGISQAGFRLHWCFPMFYLFFIINKVTDKTRRHCFVLWPCRIFAEGFVMPVVEL